MHLRGLLGLLSGLPRQPLLRGPPAVFLVMHPEGD